MRGALPGVALEQPRRRVQQEREDRAVGLGEIEGALQGAPGGGLVAERVAGDRLQQEGLPPPRPDGPRPGSRAVQDGRERGASPPAGRAGRAAATPGRCASLRPRARGSSSPARACFGAAGFTQPHQGLQHVRPRRRRRGCAARRAWPPAARRPGRQPAPRRYGHARARASRGHSGAYIPVAGSASVRRARSACSSQPLCLRQPPLPDHHAAEYRVGDAGGLAPRPSRAAAPARSPACSVALRHARATGRPRPPPACARPLTSS